ncbi:hypothetical protein BCV69DRAFT_249125 [Microstroma glucosiphilum]|uniref:Elongation factor methyltransferase 7 n=1 Tax=Pseudomicrostroma glucosiphilum TaxID=1684307 RepID=A0A316U8K2_9BASI|nr:hypothetical protein BCV69DRAFT_249125 [Pseudomicrostroma glucosiphilum]PWN20801.1 hypothetical protein BCV69DRAFT_249125 [Pseudomicrostroma glucosiphilum]
MSSHIRAADSPSPPSLNLFEEPADYRPSTPPPQTVRVPYDFTGSASSTSLSSSDPQSTSSDAQSTDLTIHLLGSHPLWGHHIWNASLDLSRYLQSHAASLLHGKSVLELGAAAGIPSIVAAREGAAVVVASDYPEQPLIDVLKRNLDENTAGSVSSGCVVAAQGYLWGASVEPLQVHLPAGQDGYDLLLLSDLIFNHQAHDALLDTMNQALSRQNARPSVLPPDTHPSRLQDDASHPDFPDKLPFGELTTAAPDGPCVLVFFTSHRPHLAHKDMEFFRKAEATGKWSVERVGRWKREPMFPTDPGSAFVRGTVHGFRLFRTGADVAR